MQTFKHSLIVCLTIFCWHQVNYNHVNCGLITGLGSLLVPSSNEQDSVEDPFDEDIETTTLTLVVRSRLTETESPLIDPPTYAQQILTLWGFPETISRWFRRRHLDLSLYKILGLLEPLHPLLDPITLPVIQLLKPVLDKIDQGVTSIDDLLLDPLDPALSPLLTILEPLLEGIGVGIKDGVARPVAYVVLPVRYIYEDTLLPVLNKLIVATGGYPIDKYELANRVGYFQHILNILNINPDGLGEAEKKVSVTGKDKRRERKENEGKMVSMVSDPFSSLRDGASGLISSVFG